MNTKSSLKKRVLIVENDTMIALMLQMCYEMLNYEVVALLETAEESIHFVQKHAIDLVSMDISQNRNQDGLFAATQLRKRAFSKPIIFISANNSIEEETLSVNNSIFLRKPIDLNDLTQAVKTFAD